MASPALKSRMAVDTALHEKHLANLADWSKKGYFTYAGRTSEGDAKFFSGECAMFTAAARPPARQRQAQRQVQLRHAAEKSLQSTDVPGAPRIRSSVAPVFG